MSRLDIAVAALMGGGIALVLFAWLSDPESDAGCDDPRMNCNTTTQESE